MTLRARLALPAIVLLAGGALGRSVIALAAPAPAPGAVVRIEGLTHAARGVLRAGDRVTVTLRGTGGGSATFHIFGVVTDVGMREIRTGVYQAQAAMYIGTYIVRPGDGARNAAVSATLTVRGADAMGFSPRSVSIDTTPPLLTSLHPRPDAALSNARPNIVVGLFDRESSVNRGASRLFVNGQNVTARASISDNVISYTPEAPFPVGPVRVQVVAADVGRNAARAVWSFRITSGDGLIHSVTITPATPLRSGDVLTVVMTGAAGGRASFAIQGVTGAASPMRERNPGLYVGSYPVGGGPTVINAPLLVSLEKNGRRSTAPASAPVALLPAAPPAPTVAAPGRAIVLGQEVVTRLILRGRSLPGMRIAGRLTYEGRGAEEAGPLGEFAAMTGTDGGWQATFGPFILPDGARLVMTVVAVDPAGQRSPSVVYSVAP